MKPKSQERSKRSHKAINQKRLPPRLIGCLAPRLVGGPATIPSPPSDSLELRTTCLAFFVTGGLAGGGEESDAKVFLVGLRASIGGSEFDVGWLTFFPSTGGDERVFGTSTGEAGFFNISCSSSESSVAESSSGFAFGGPVSSLSHDRCCDFGRVDSSQSGTWIRQVSVHSTAC